MKLAIAQTDIAFENYAENQNTAKAWIEKAAEAKADAIFFPEMSFTGFSMHVSQIAPYGADAVHAMRQLAKKQHIAIGFGYVAKAADGRGQNRYQVVLPSGEICLDYQKIHPFSYGKEDQYYEKGSRIAVGNLCGVPLSALICYDLRFPEVFRLAAQKASILLVPANWLAQRSSHWNTLLRARAIENQVYVLGINCVGRQNTLKFLGQSACYDPEGNCLVQCDQNASLSYVTIETPVSQFRSAFPTAEDARLSWYTAAYQQLEP